MAIAGSKKARTTGIALMFLAPNILGVLTFVIFPLVFSIVLAFTNWDLRRHNQYKDEPLEFVGLENFIRLLTEGDFVRYLGNTLFLMILIPFAVGGSLLAAMLLSKDTRGGGGRVYAYLVAAGLLLVSAMMLTAAGLAESGMLILLCGVAGGIALMGLGGGITVYRTLFYLPHFTAGVATFLLWKKLYKPEGGPINTALTPVLEGLTGAINAVPSAVVGNLRWLMVAAAAWIVWWLLTKIRRMWSDGDLGTQAALIPMVIIFIPLGVAWAWGPTRWESFAMLSVAGIAQARNLRYFRRPREVDPPHEMEGFGNGLMTSLFAMVCVFTLVGFTAVIQSLPGMAASENGLQPPEWINDAAWAKPSLMIMGLWGAIGSNNMLLYLAALTNVPGELYEAADIDGATPFQRFWNVTWPQLAPTTFFIAVMSTIHGLQGGFEMARTMTEGGPAGATTTLSYFIYQEGFETGRLSFAAATAWALFILVFSITMFNWKFGNKYVND